MHKLDGPNGKYLTKEIIIAIVEAGVREKRLSKQPDPFINSLKSGVKYPVTAVWQHESDSIRLEVYFGSEISKTIDMSVKRYESLPIVGEPFEELRAINAAQGWYERKTKTLIRDPKFPKKVYAAYNFQCALCDVRNQKLLVAAHIKPLRSNDAPDNSVNNGICLCGTHDKAYENGVILIDADGNIEIPSGDLEIKQSRMRFPSNPLHYPSKEYLQFRYDMFSSK